MRSVMQPERERYLFRWVNKPISDARSALERKESRGAQFREDYPDKSSEEAKTIVVVRRADDGSMEVSREPVPETPQYLRQIIEEMG